MTPVLLMMKKSSATQHLRLVALSYILGGAGFLATVGLEVFFLLLCCRTSI